MMQFKMGKTLQAFLQQRQTNGQQSYKKMFRVFSHQGNTNENYYPIPLHIPVGWLIAKRQTIGVLVRMQRNCNLHPFLVGMQNGVAFWIAVRQFLNILNIELPYCHEIPLLYKHTHAHTHTPKGTENLCSHKNLYTNVYSSIIHNGQKGETTQMSSR